VFSTTILKLSIYVYKGHQAPIRIGQYDAFPGISTYPLNVYSDSSTYPSVGAISRELIESGTANCVLDPSKFFLTAPKVGTCSVRAVRSGTALFLPETVTATIYWIEFKNNFVTQVQSVPTQIALSGQVQIIKHNYETMTINSFNLQTNVESPITSAAWGDVIRIWTTGIYDDTDSTLAIHLGGRIDLYLAYGDFSMYNEPKTTLNNFVLGGLLMDGKSEGYFEFTVPEGTETDYVLVETAKGTVSSPNKLTIVTK
jgi:hypothetical protein